MGKFGHNKLFVSPGIKLVDSEIELFFLALPHGTAAEYAIPLLAAEKKIIDLSADFRLNDPATYEEFYGAKHPAPWLPLAQYGLPELHDLRREHSSYRLTWVLSN